MLNENDFTKKIQITSYSIKILWGNIKTKEENHRVCICDTLEFSTGKEKNKHKGQSKKKMLWHIWQAITLDLSSLIFQKFLQITGGREDIPQIAQEKKWVKILNRKFTTNGQ